MTLNNLVWVAQIVVFWVSDFGFRIASQDERGDQKRERFVLVVLNGVILDLDCTSERFSP